MNTSYILITIILAIASGLSIIAYKTPNIYKKLFFYLVIADMLVVVAINFWRAGYKYSGSIVWRYVDEKKLTEARMALEQQNLLPEFSHIYAILAGVFILFLYWLAGEVIKNREQEKQKR